MSTPLVISALSLAYVKVPVAAEEDGDPVDPTSGTVTMAFPAPGVAPVSDDWKTASWETVDGDPPVYNARCLVGPAGAVTLTAGDYDVWTKVAGLSPETPVLKSGGSLRVR